MPFGPHLELDPGEHVLQLDGADLLTTTASVRLERGQAKTLSVAMAPKDSGTTTIEPKGGGASARPWWPFGVGGVGVVALGAGATLGILGHLQASQLRAEPCAPYCDPSVLDPVRTMW